MKVSELRELAAQKAEDAREIKDKAEAEGRGLTQEEADKFDGLLDESQRYEAQANRQERLEETEARLNESQERKSTPEIATGERIEVAGPKLYRHGELRAFKGDKAQINAYRSGRFLAAVLFGHAPSRQWCDDHGVKIRVDHSFDNRAMGEGISTKGGFIVHQGRLHRAR